MRGRRGRGWQNYVVGRLPESTQKPIQLLIGRDGVSTYKLTKILGSKPGFVISREEWKWTYIKPGVLLVGRVVRLSVETIVPWNGTGCPDAHLDGNSRPRPTAPTAARPVGRDSSRPPSDNQRSSLQGRRASSSTYNRSRKCRSTR